MVLQVGLTVIPACAAIVAATIAARSAKKTKRFEIEAQRIRELESRISDKKYDVYKPMINLIRDMLDQRSIDDEDSRSKISDFATWVAIYGSDEAVRAFRNFMQAAFHSAPPIVLMKLYSEFVLAARRDIGQAETKITELDFLGARIRDLHQSDLLIGIGRPLLEICADHGWSPPWLDGPVSRA